MTRYIVRRVLGAIPVLFIISFMIYGILLIAPGGPQARFAQNPKITTAQIDAFRQRWGLDQPVPVQYCRWLGACNPNATSAVTVFLSDKGLPNILPGFLGGGDNGVLHGDFGFSIRDGRPVSTVIGERVLPTAILAGTAWVIWLTIALLAGMYAAVRRYGLFDSGLTIFSYIGLSLPTFWLGIMLLTVFASTLKILPAGGMWTARDVPIFGTSEYWTFVSAKPLAAFLDLGWHLVLPVFTLVVVSIAYDSRFVRAAMIDSLGQDYVRTARAKGVPERRVVMKHALRNALLPIITNIGLEIPFLFTGAIVTETIFSWPGMGRLSIEATINYDYPVLMGILLIAAVLTVSANLLADILYAVVDPRISYG
jgi:peptide/nickel transport system permease protein